MMALNFNILPEWESVANYNIVSVFSGRENNLCSRCLPLTY